MDKPGLKAALLPGCTTTFKVTVFRSRETEEVLFLEAGKDFVDTLLSFLVLPMGTIINAILSQGMIPVNSLGGISCMFKSLDISFLQADMNHVVQSRPAVIDCTCEPSISVQFEEDLVSAQIMQPSLYSSPPLLYKCTHDSCGLYSRDQGTICRICPNLTRIPHTYSNGPYLERRHKPAVRMNGYVKENMKFIVTDKLEIIPSSINKSMSLLKKLDLTSVDDTESAMITVGITQIVELLHSALTSKECLNDVFGEPGEVSDVR